MRADDIEGAESSPHHAKNEPLILERSGGDKIKKKQKYKQDKKQCDIITFIRKDFILDETKIQKLLEFSKAKREMLNGSALKPNEHEEQYVSYSPQYSDKDLLLQSPTYSSQEQAAEKHNGKRNTTHATLAYAIKRKQVLR